MTQEEITETLKEIVNRFCDRPENEAKCSDKDALIENIIAKIAKKTSDAEVEVEAEVPEVAATRRRLLTTNPADLLNTACNDPDAVDSSSLVVTTEGQSGGGSPTPPKGSTSSASVASISLAAVALPAVVFL
jgi:hypothetical protein